jgi:hypothetical protein
MEKAMLSKYVLMADRFFHGVPHPYSPWRPLSGFF